MNNSSPAHSSLSTTAVVGGGGGGGGGSNATVSGDDFIFPSDHMSSLERKDETMIGGLHSFYFLCCDLLSKLNLCGHFTIDMYIIPVSY